MDVDWEIEVGGNAPVIEADWAGFIDLCTHPERISEIAEAAAFSPLAALLLSLNGPQSIVWTSKCDLWEPEPGALACYVDLLPREGAVFRTLQQAEAFCRQLICALDPWTSLAEISGRTGKVTLCSGQNSAPDASLTVVIRQAIAAGVEGYGVTIYLSSKQTSVYDARQAMAAAIAAVTNTLSGAELPKIAGSKLK